MKASTIVLLIISAVLIIAGVILLLVGDAMAKSKNVDLFRSQSEINEQGLNFETHDIDTDTEDLIIAVKANKETNINVIGNAEKSYVEIINFPKNQFEYTNSNKKMYLRKIGSFTDYFSITSIKENGFDSWGLRYFVSDNVDKEQPYTVNLYISSASAFKSLKIECLEGSVSLENIALSTIEYDLSVKDGMINVKHVRNAPSMKVDIKNGNLAFTNNSITETNVNIEKGNVIANINTQNNLVLKCKNGVIYTNFKNDQTEIQDQITEYFTEIFPSYEQLGTAQSGTIPQFTANVETGSASVFYGYETDDDFEEESETAEEEAETNETEEAA